MAMTTATMNAPVPENPKPATRQLTPEEVVKVAATVQANAAAKEEAEVLLGATSEFQDQLDKDAIAAARVMAEQYKAQGTEVKISDLVEEDAYNLDITINASRLGNPDFLKVVMKDKNYIARWGNRHELRQSQLVAQGFRNVRKEEVDNLEDLEMFLDSRDFFVWTDLICMKIPKNIYYAGLRRAYTKSLHATNNKAAAQAGAAEASQKLNFSLTGPERAYMAAQQASGHKPVYNPTIGV